MLPDCQIADYYIYCARDLIAITFSLRSVPAQPHNQAQGLQWEKVAALKFVFGNPDEPTIAGELLWCLVAYLYKSKMY
jgi:hypothetical protein